MSIGSRSSPRPACGLSPSPSLLLRRSRKTQLGLFLRAAGTPGRPRCFIGMEHAPSHKSLWLSGRVACALCWENRRGRSNHAGHAGYVAPKKRRKEFNLVSFLRRRTADAAATAPPASTSGLAGERPALAEFLTATAYEDGSPRVTGTVLAFAEAGVWKACVSDRDQSMYAFITASCWESLWDAVEDALAANTLDWRVKTAAGKPPRK